MKSNTLNTPVLTDFHQLIKMNFILFSADFLGLWNSC